MKTITLKNIAPHSSFLRVAQCAVDYAKAQRSMVRFTMVRGARRQSFVASPKKPLATLVWEWTKSKAGRKFTGPQRKAKATEIPAAV